MTYPDDLYDIIERPAIRHSNVTRIQQCERYSSGRHKRRQSRSSANSDLSTQIETGLPCLRCADE